MMITTKLEKAGGRTSHVALNQKVEKLLLQASTTSREPLVSKGALKEAQASSAPFAKQHCSTVVPGWWYGYPYKVLSSRLTAKLLQVQLATRNEEGRLFSLHIHTRGAAPAGSAMTSAVRSSARYRRIAWPGFRLGSYLPADQMVRVLLWNCLPHQHGPMIV